MTREEEWLGAIAGMPGVNPPDYPVWHYEQMLAAIYDAVMGASPARAFPPCSWHLDEILYAIYCELAGLEHGTPPPATCRIEEFWLGIYGRLTGDASAAIPTPVWRIEEFLAGVFDAADGWGGTELSGNVPLTLANALAGKIKRLVQYGLCTQASTPTLADPVDIYCNRGKLTAVDGEVVVVGSPASDNLYDASKRTDNTRIKYLGTVEEYEGMCYSEAIPLNIGGKQCVTLVCGDNVGAGQVDRWIVWLSDDETPSPDNWGGFSYIAVGSTCYPGKRIWASYSIAADTDKPFARIVMQMNDTLVGVYKGEHTYQPYAEGELIAVANESENLIDESTNITGYYLNASGVANQGADAQYTDLIPVITGEKYTWSLTSNRTGGGNNRWHGYKADGTWKQQIAYKNTGAGTGLPFELSARIPIDIAYVRLSYGINDTDVDFRQSINQYATAEPLLAVGDVKDEQDIIKGRVTRRCAACVYDGTQPVGDSYISTTGGKDVGAIIVYPLESPVTEAVTAQPLTTAEGTNIIDVTSEVSPIALDVVYKAANNG